MLKKKSTKNYHIKTFNIEDDHAEVINYANSIFPISSNYLLTFRSPNGVVVELLRL